MSNSPEHRSGFVSLVGRPNAGKSTLLNALVGTKIAIVANKPQTTRTAVQGVLTRPDAQVVFLDTPGIHQSDTVLNRRMMEEVRTALDSRDLLLFVADATRPFTEQDGHAIDLIRKYDTPAFLLLNKVDHVEDKGKLLPLLQQYQGAFQFAESLPVSATRGEGLAKLQELIVRHLPVGPPYFPEDYLTDQPERFLAAELIREKILRETQQEVPHSVAVLVDVWEVTPKLTRIMATIFVERPGQKAIIIGAKGAMLKKVGTMARHDIERLIDGKVYLELFVKVRENWRESPEFLNEIDWRSMISPEAP